MERGGERKLQHFTLNFAAEKGTVRPNITHSLLLQRMLKRYGRHLKVGVHHMLRSDL